jgi:tetratricopeptide (TPR) repeat protein
MKKLLRVIVVGVLSANATMLVAQMTPEVLQLEERWAEVNYLTQGKSQVEAFSSLIEQARQVTKAQPNSAEAWIWSGIIQSSYAGAKGGLGALSSAKAAKADLEKAIDINPDVLEGAVYTSLGVLYLNVPGWPVGFGDEDAGVTLLKQGLQISPDGIDSNYFYAEYLFKEKEYNVAQRHLRKALAAAPRDGREIADDGRRGEIQHMLEEIEEQR